jgi:hypothetical protein
MTDTFLCERCGQHHPCSDRQEFDGKVFCSECLEEVSDVCSYCGRRILVYTNAGDDQITLCQDCYDAYYTTCFDCGVILRRDDAYFNAEDEYVCANCHQSNQSKYAIHNYYYKPSPIFYGTEGRFYGVELEVDRGGKDGDNAKTLLDTANYRDEHIYIKSDGSIDDGFEIVSHPMTLDYHINNMDWHCIMHDCIRMGYRSHQTSTCGLHVHIGRKELGKTVSEQEEVISKIMYFIEHHWNEMVKFSRRSEYSINRWAARYGYENNAKDILDKAKSGTNGRYAAVNICNYNTVEIRIFRGTLKYTSFIATLQMVDVICDVAFSMSEYDLHKLSWSEFVSNIDKSKYPELIQYLKERKLYVNEPTINEEEL